MTKEIQEVVERQKQREAKNKRFWYECESWCKTLAKFNWNDDHGRYFDAKGQFADWIDETGGRDDIHRHDRLVAGQRWALKEGKRPHKVDTPQIQIRWAIGGGWYEDNEYSRRFPVHSILPRTLFHSRPPTSGSHYDTFGHTEEHLLNCELIFLQQCQHIVWSPEFTPLYREPPYNMDVQEFLKREQVKYVHVYDDFSNQEIANRGVSLYPNEAIVFRCYNLAFWNNTQALYTFTEREIVLIQEQRRPLLDGVLVRSQRDQSPRFGPVTHFLRAPEFTHRYPDGTDLRMNNFFNLDSLPLPIVNQDQVDAVGLAFEALRRRRNPPRPPEPPFFHTDLP